MDRSLSTNRGHSATSPTRTRVRYESRAYKTRPLWRQEPERIRTPRQAGIAAFRPSGYGPLLALAQNEKCLRLDAVVLHGIRRGVAPHELLEGLHVRDLSDERGLVGSIWVREGPNGDANWPEYLFTLRRAQPLVDIVHFMGDHVRGHRVVLSSPPPDVESPAPLTLRATLPMGEQGVNGVGGRLQAEGSQPVRGHDLHRDMTVA